MSCSFFLARSQFAKISSCRRLAHSRTNWSARGSRLPARTPVHRYRGATSCVVGVEVGHRVIPLVPVHVDHHSVERANPRHEPDDSSADTRRRLLIRAGSARHCYHQQYLSSNKSPYGYSPDHGTGVSCPVGVAKADG